MENLEGACIKNETVKMQRFDQAAQCNTTKTPPTSISLTWLAIGTITALWTSKVVTVAA